MKANEIERLLPEVFQRALAPQTPLQATLDVMERLHEPAESVLEQLPRLVNPYHTDERYLTMLAYWMNLEWIFPPRPTGASEPDWTQRRPPVAPGRLRALIAAAASLSQWRGTACGLQRFLEIATGDTSFRIDDAVTRDDGTLIPFHLSVVASQQMQPQRELIERIVEAEKPAYVTWELNFEQAII